MRRLPLLLALLTTVLTLIALAALFVASRSIGATPSLVLSFVRYERGPDANYGIVQIRNAGPGTACYYGYGVDSPFYQVMVDSPEGWTPQSLGWCGTGADPALLPSGNVTTFRVYMRTNQTWKVGVTFSEPALQDRLPRFMARWLPSSWQSQPPNYTAWSPPILADPNAPERVPNAPF